MLRVLYVLWLLSTCLPYNTLRMLCVAWVPIHVLRVL
jgi:hypothetical protein